MLISDLDAVNGVLQELGEQPLLSLDTNYPTADLAKKALATAKLEFLQRGWWFNTIENFSIAPNSNGQFLTPDHTLEFIPDSPQFIWSGQYIMDHSGNVNLTNVTKVTGKLKFTLKSQALPWTAQQIIMLLAASKVYVSDFGPDSKYQEIMLRLRELTNVLSAQHIRAKRPNMAQRPEVARYYSSLRT